MQRAIFQLLDAHVTLSYDARAALDIQLSSGEMHQLEEPYHPHPLLGHS